MEKTTEKIKKFPIKKAAIVLGVLAFLSGASYVLGNNFGQKKAGNDFVDLGNGKRMKVEAAESSRENEKPEMMGKIKSINESSLVIEKYTMPKRTGNNAGEAGKGKDERGGQFNNQKQGVNRPQLQVEGEETLTLNNNTAILKNSQSLEMGPGKRDNSQAEPEEISVGDLKEGDMVSIWLADGDEKNVAQKILVRGM